MTNLSPTDASVKDLRKAGFQARAFQGFQLRPERPDLLVIDEASMLSVPQMLWVVKHARENDCRVLLVGDSAQHRSVERGDALRILERSGTVRYVELLQTQRQKVPALKVAIEDLKVGSKDCTSLLPPLPSPWRLLRFSNSRDSIIGPAASRVSSSTRQRRPSVCRLTYFPLFSGKFPS